jgi:hypothetical protein
MNVISVYIFAAMFIVMMAILVLQFVMVDKLNRRLPGQAERFSPAGRYTPYLSQFDRTYREYFPNDLMWRLRSALHVLFSLGMLILIVSVIIWH